MDGEHDPATKPEDDVDSEDKTVQELVDEGYVGFIRGSDGFAIVDPIMPERPEDWDKRRWRCDF